MKHAKAGGEVGTNGEFYEGGKFLPSTTLPKQEAAKKRKSSGKQEIAPFIWEIAPAEGMRSVWTQAKVYAMPIWEGRTIVRLEPYMLALSHLADDHRAKMIELMLLWNSGQRWYWPEEV